MVDLLCSWALRLVLSMVRDAWTQMGESGLNVKLFYVSYRAQMGWSRPSSVLFSVLTSAEFLGFT